MISFHLPGQKREKLPVGNISLVHHLTKLLGSQWKNGGMLLVVDERSSPGYRRGGHQPRFLLTEVTSRNRILI